MTSHGPERTCIGCRGVFQKREVVRIVAGPEGPVLDYREKLPGRAAYLCPRRECIERGLSRETLSRALKTRVKAPLPDEFTGQLITGITGKIRSLTTMSAKAGKLAAGYSAVKDSLEKGRCELILYAGDLSDGTKEKLLQHGAGSVSDAVLFTRAELGEILNRELVGVIAFEETGLADAVRKETVRLKNLINSGH